MDIKIEEPLMEKEGEDDNKKQTESSETVRKVMSALNTVKIVTILIVLIVCWMRTNTLRET